MAPSSSGVRRPATWTPAESSVETRAGEPVSLVPGAKGAPSAKKPPVRTPPVPPRPSARVVEMAEGSGDQSALISQLMTQVKTLTDQMEVLSRERSGRSASRDSRRSRRSRRARRSRSRRRSPHDHRHHRRRRGHRDPSGERIPVASAGASVAAP